jgi:predicted KAP-like P-loop ATPase
MKENKKTETMDKTPIHTEDKSKEALIREYQEEQAKKQIDTIKNNTQILKIQNDLLSEKVENMELTIKQANLLDRHSKAVKILETYNKKDK